MIAEREVGDVSPDAKPARKNDVEWHEEPEPVPENPSQHTKNNKDNAVTDDQLEHDDEEAGNADASKSRLIPFLKRYWILHLCAAIGLAILANLSLWQFDRLDQKVALIERAEVRAKEAPVAAPGPATWAELSSDEIDYMPVEVSGQFIIGELFYFDTLSKPKGPLGGQGYFVYAPFITNDGWTVLVNRGFVPIDRKDFSTRLGSAPPRGQMTITGLARRAEVASMFSAEPNLSTNEWYVREPKAMAEAMGMLADQTAPYTIDLQETVSVAGDLPQAGETRMTFSNNHLQYAFTWAGLALTLVGVYFAFLIKAWFNQDKPVVKDDDEDEDDDYDAEEEKRKADRYKMISDAARRPRR
ncbi:Surfeit locus 1 family protein [Pseudovibrio sp. FO-BEG1]|uniref:SURF1 family protein n=1 Tax=Pseudovibrio sp. (strain FO-BEG1) TaxID=911045 RepID=UPI000238C555|nr:SURF1 family protein [Pseudovibrio sp. FO-BEG1]AEV36071.1 Surfeit locus 1 family protein [Pseudovibrio sp. FO-BEG1]